MSEERRIDVTTGPSDKAIEAAQGARGARPPSSTVQMEREHAVRRAYPIIRADVIAEVRAAVVEHFESWTSANSGDLRRNAYPRDLALWEAFGLIERETRDA